MDLRETSGAVLYNVYRAKGSALFMDNIWQLEFWNRTAGLATALHDPVINILVRTLASVVIRDSINLWNDGRQIGCSATSPGRAYDAEDSEGSQLLHTRVNQVSGNSIKA